MKKGFLKKVLSTVVVTSLVFASTVSAMADTHQEENESYTLSIDKQIEVRKNLNIFTQAPPFDKVSLDDAPVAIVEKDASYKVTVKANSIFTDASVYSETAKGSGIFQFVGEIEQNGYYDVTNEGGYLEKGTSWGYKIFPADIDDSSSIVILNIATGASDDEQHNYIFATGNLTALKGTTSPSSKPADQSPTTSNLTTAKSTNSTILVNGKNVEFEAYNINGNNYFKLRDLAMALNGTEKQFNVMYNNDLKEIQLSGFGVAYTPVGGELAKGDGKNKDAKLSGQKVTDGLISFNFEAYNINGNNYVKLRDIAQHFYFGVTYDNVTKTVGIDTSISYTE